MSQNNNMDTNKKDFGAKDLNSSFGSTQSSDLVEISNEKLNQKEIKKIDTAPIEKEVLEELRNELPKTSATGVKEWPKEENKNPDVMAEVFKEFKNLFKEEVFQRDTIYEQNGFLLNSDKLEQFSMFLGVVSEFLGNSKDFSEDFLKASKDLAVCEFKIA